jgi:hypothetical protein
MKGPKHHRFKRHIATFAHKITPVFSIIPAFIQVGTKWRERQ